MKAFINMLLIGIVLVSVSSCASASVCLSGSSSNFLDRLRGPSSCPESGSDPDNSFCCENEAGLIYCCNVAEFLRKSGLAVIISVIVSVIVSFLLICCLCCCCCPCCLLYKRRHGGTVYGRVQQTTVLTVPAPANQFAMPPNSQYATNGCQGMQPINQYPNQVAPPYPGMPQPAVGTAQHMPPQPGFAHPNQPPYPDYSAQQPPPPFSVATANEGYVKQAPFNPNF